MVLLAREFGWTLEEIRRLKPSELKAILNELQKQKEIINITEQYNHWASLSAVISNASSSICGTIAGKKGKQFKADDFMTKEALKKIKEIERKTKITEAKPNDDLASLISEAKAKGLKGPWGW